MACIFLYLAIKKGFEPLLLSSDCIWYAACKYLPGYYRKHRKDAATVSGGLFHYFYTLDEWSILPSLIFLGVGAMTDFGPLIANPISFLLGAAAQFGIFGAYFLAILLGFNDKAAAAVSIIGGADGPTSIFLAGKLGQTGLMGPIAVAAYSYMALSSDHPAADHEIIYNQRKSVRSRWRTFVRYQSWRRSYSQSWLPLLCVLILPTTAPLVGMLMLGNLFRESGVVRQLSETASNALDVYRSYLTRYICWCNHQCRSILKLDNDLKDRYHLVLLHLCSVLRPVYYLVNYYAGSPRGKINPLIGSAGVSAVPMAARVSQKVGAEEDPTNFLLMHAMGPNVAGVIGTAVAAGCIHGNLWNLREEIENHGRSC